MTGPQVRSPLGQVVRLVVGLALIAFLAWFLVQTIASGAAAVIVLGFFAVLYVGIDLSQRRRHRFLTQLRGLEPVAFVLREPSVWETGWITSNETTIGLWRSAKGQAVPVMEVDRSTVAFEPAVLPVSNFHQRPGLRMLVNGEELTEFWLLHDRHGVFRRRLEGAEEDRAVALLLGSV